MEIEAGFPMTDDQYRSYVVSSLVAIHAKLAVLFEVQTHLMAKAYGTDQQEQKKELMRALDEATALAAESARIGRAVV